MAALCTDPRGASISYLVILLGIADREIDPMSETLLKNNRRAVLTLVALWVLIGLSSFIVWRLAVVRGASTFVTWGAGIATLITCVIAIRTYLWGRQPRVALTDDSVRVLTRGFELAPVPIDAVECFFIGQDVGTHVQRTSGGSRVANVTIVVRLAQRATDWHQRTMEPSLGRWADGYITLHGLWCEPIDGDFVNEMNHRLAAAKRQRRKAQA